MLRAKSRSSSIDFGHKSHSSIFSRTITASKLCKGDVVASQIESNALVSADKKLSRAANLPEKRIDRIVIMQEQMARDGKDGSRGENRELKQAAREALSPKRSGDLYAEIKSLKELLSNSKDELKKRDNKIEFLELELKNAKKSEIEMAGRDSLIDKLQAELQKLRASEARATVLLGDNKRNVVELEGEVERCKTSELKMLESLEHQTKQLEQTKIELEESKLELASLHKQVVILETVPKKNKENIYPAREELESLKSELELAKIQLAHSEEGKAIISMNVKDLQDEIELMKNELKLATEAEETSKKAMDGLALALKEVATEANQTKEKLSITLLELEHVKEEAEQLKDMVRSTEERHRQLTDEAMKEKDLYKNTADRLRLEAEESLFAWNGKEMGFVSCIRSAEEEKLLAQHENAKLAESLRSAELMSRVAKDENHKLRDILKQAINEANAAKAAASIAREENSQLQDSLAEKEEMLHFLAKENERLRLNEVVAHENAKEYKRLLSSASMESKLESKVSGEMFKSPISYNEKDVEKAEKKTLSFDMDELKLLNDQDNAGEEMKPEDPAKAEALKGSIFDSQDSPRSEPRTPKFVSLHHKAYSTPINGGRPTSEYSDSVASHLYESDSEKHSGRRRKLFRRVGDIIMMKRLIQ